PIGSWCSIAAAFTRRGRTVSCSGWAVSTRACTSSAAVPACDDVPERGVRAGAPDPAGSRGDLRTGGGAGGPRPLGPRGGWCHAQLPRRRAVAPRGEFPRADQPAAPGQRDAHAANPPGAGGRRLATGPGAAGALPVGADARGPAAPATPAATLRSGDAACDWR